MKKILAVSGGVDSMVLLDLFKDDEDILVAHFNHGTRKSADNDETFVQKRCEELGVKIIVGKSELGPNVSEEKAREARYKFLFKVREDVLKQSPNEEVKIFTAHHLDDLVESVFINLIRGTSWRGLTPFSTENVVRPFLLDDVLMPESKADILVYAARNKIVFREDPTNSSDKYLRNRIREIVSTMDPEKHFKLNQKIKTLYFSQQKKRTEIEEILDSMMPENGVLKREWFSDLDDKVSIEILRFALEKNEIKLTGPQLNDFLFAIRNYAPEKKFNLPNDKLVTIHKNYFKI
ncbi:tRNA lysidine(34) synthetase TilS [Candidatus Saccharibacteria bacterium]|nr:tRNA lysidine(34) synthetase TilS [Candidatus Saccharibacteria bacterium]